MSLSHRVGPRAGDDQVPEPRLDSPAAARRHARRWSDPRLWVGVGFVLVSVVVGATVLDSRNSTEAVWRLRHDISAGSSVSAADLELTEVHFADDTGHQYMSASLPLASSTRVVRDVGAGELLATSATTTTSAVAPQQMPLGVPGSGVPADLEPGDHVDVWAVATSDQGTPPDPAQVLKDVTVTEVSAAGPGGLDADRQILVSLPADTDVGAALATLNGTSIVLIERA